MAKGKEPIMASQPVKGKKKSNGRNALQNGKPGESSSMAVGKAKASEDELLKDELMQSLNRHDASFTALLSLIPANLYLAPESDSEAGSEIGEISLDQTSSNPLSKRKIAELTAEERKARIREAKRAKHDPENQKNAIQIQQERAAKRAERLAAQEREEEQDLSLNFSMGSDLMMNGNEGAGDTDDDEDSEEDHDEDDDDDGDSYETLPTSTKGSEELSDKPAIPSPLPGAGPPNILDLRARLQAKIQGIQAQRRAQALGQNSHGEIGDDESIASTKDELLEERRKQRGEMRDRRRKAAKERKRAEREGTAPKKGNGQNAGNDKKGTTAPQLFVSPVNGKSVAPSTSSLANVTDSNDIAFSSLQFDGQSLDSLKKSKHALPSDPKAALAILEARKRKEEARRAKIEARGEDAEGSSTKKDAEQAEKDRAEHIKWSKAEAAAQGVKIRDDEALLRKAAKKRDKQKAKSSTEWGKRNRDLASQQAARQKKRQDNIAARKDKKGGGKSGGGGGGKSGSSSSNAHSAKSKALGSKRKSGSSRPGFEGKGRSFGGKKASSSGGVGKKQGRK
ncbi:uncharacterized protein FA14DRAFT_162211 [Meira miltonrushii]|uniref:SURF6-domain-containing protein n=1 Tax=Meira miltonrushii TaxID=1280837 RepID=A0A316V7R6_9BASI|nr:uncharacterized protein FA14DRAFT_162211 [Meira miltonrushii]PWN33068.1 hypothetical protein FA14DRAFT_162211 [Meira miltonrushii]